LLFLLFYQALCIKADLKIMMFIAIMLQFFGKASVFSLLRGFTFGLSPFYFMMISDAAIGELLSVIDLIPTGIVFAKLIPNNVEASVYALITGLINFANFFLNRMLGNFINTFVKVRRDSLDKLWQLYAIASVLSFLPLFFLWLVPSRKSIE